MSERAPETDAEYQARRERERAEFRRWLDAYNDLRPGLWFVLRHSGRSRARWRVVFQSRSKAEAEDWYLRKAYPRTRKDITYAATALYEGGLTWDCKRSQSGQEPLDGSVPITIENEIKTAEEREAREARQAKRARRRVEVPALQPLRIEVPARVEVDVEEAPQEEEGDVVARRRVR